MRIWNILYIFMEEQILLLSQYMISQTRFKAKQYKVLKKMIKDYGLIQKYYFHKLINDPSAIHSAETENFTHQIEDLQLTFLSNQSFIFIDLAEDLKNIGAYQAQAALLALFELIKQSYYFSLRLKSLNKVDSQVQSRKPFYENLCPSCYENTQKIYISKLKQNFLLTETGTFPERDFKSQKNSIDQMRQCNEYREYLIEGSAFVKQIEEVLASKVKHLVSGSGEMAKAYLYLTENIKNMKQNSKSFSWKQTEFEGMDSEKILEKLKGQFLQSFISSVREPIFKVIMKLQGNSVANSPTFTNTETQTQFLEDTNRIKYLQLDNIRLQRQLQSIKQSKAQIQAESINYIKKQTLFQEKLLEYRKQNLRIEEKNKILSEKNLMLQQKLVEQQKWREQEKQFLTQPLLSEIRKRRENQEKLENQLKELMTRFMNQEKSLKSSLQRKNKLRKQEGSSSEEFFETNTQVLNEKNINKLKPFKVSKKRKKKQKLKIQESVSLLINSPKPFRLKKENVKKSRISYLKQLKPKKQTESSFEDEELKRKYPTTERNEKRQRSKFKQEYNQNQFLQISVSKKQSSHFNEREQFTELKDIRKNYERKKTVKNHSLRMLMGQMKSADRIKIKTQGQQNKLVQISQEHFLLFGGEKSAYEYEKNIGIWPHLNSSDKLVLDFENTHLSNQIQKYFQFLSWTKPEKYVQYGEFLKSPHSFVSQRKKNEKSKKILPNLQKEKYNFQCIFNKLIRFHRINHKNCTHVSNFLQKIGFQEL